MERDNPVLVALDGMSPEKAYEIAEKLKGLVGGFKANDLLDAVGPENAIKELRKYGEIVMADPKLSDIPNTVGNRMRHYANFGADLVTVKAESGIEAMIAALDNADEIFAIKRPGLPFARVVAITVPTSLTEEQCQLIYHLPVKAAVLNFAKNAFIAGVDAIVCSPQELDFLSQFKYLDSIDCRITPGIVPEWMQKPGDQKRVATPGDAIKKGASYLVIGRSATNPPEKVGTSVDAVQLILDEIENTRNEMEEVKK